MESTSIAATEQVRVVASAIYDKREEGQLRGMLG
jgi:hypothetical protein